MKIRIKGNSIRLWLTQSDVDEFCELGHSIDKVAKGFEKTAERSKGIGYYLQKL